VADPGLNVLMEFAPELATMLVDGGIQIVGSREIAAAEEAAPFEAGVLAVTPLRPLLISYEPYLSAPVDSERPWEHVHARAVARFLTRYLDSDDEHVTIIDADGANSRPVREVPDSYWSTFIYAEGGDEFTSGKSDPRAMHRIVARLRAPDGCPWDRKQTHASLAPHLVDEVYELVDAIERGDMANLAEELGDLYLLILMQAQIAHENGDFSIDDVYRGITTKIVGRHPHVFGDAAASNPDDVVGIWQQVKAKERAEDGKTSGKDVDGEPFSMPALTRATRVLTKNPIAIDENTPPLLREVAAIIARGEDPDTVLREQLRTHVQVRS